MLEFYERRKLRRMLYSKWTILLLLVIVLFLLNAVWNVFQKSRSTEEKRTFVARELKELVEREKSLQEEIDRLGTPRGLEEEIRDTFSVARVGEEVVVIVDAPANGDTAGEGEEKSWWERIFEWLTN